jgi:hypothetical protein
MHREKRVMRAKLQRYLLVITGIVAAAALTVVALGPGTSVRAAEPSRSDLNLAIKIWDGSFTFDFTLASNLESDETDPTPSPTATPTDEPTPTPPPSTSPTPSPTASPCPSSIHISNTGSGSRVEVNCSWRTTTRFGSSNSFIFRHHNYQYSSGGTSTNHSTNTTNISITSD